MGTDPEREINVRGIVSRASRAPPSLADVVSRLGIDVSMWLFLVGTSSDASAGAVARARRPP